jgi:RNA repair, ligase-Pnkp-associating, region of Hen1
VHKHPARVQAFDVSAGTAHVFFPEAAQDRCTASLLLEVDPIELVRSRKGPSGEGFELGQYVNDRPYAASSLLAVALARVFIHGAGRPLCRPPGTRRHRDAAGDPGSGAAVPWRSRTGCTAVRAAGNSIHLPV